MKTIVLDIETIPADLPWVHEDIANTISPPGSMKKAETIAAWEKDKKPGLIDEKFSRGGLDAATGEVFCIGYQVDDEDPKCIAGDEEYVLSEFMAMLNMVYDTDKRWPLLVGHNLIGFDLPFIYRRCVVNGIRPPAEFPSPAELKPWSTTVFDTMTEWAGARDRISMDKLAKVFGLEGKQGITGADVYPMYQAEKFDEIAEYCLQDVALTKAIYDKLTFKQSEIQEAAA